MPSNSALKKERNQLNHKKIINKRKTTWKQKILENSQYFFQYVNFNEL